MPEKEYRWNLKVYSEDHIPVSIAIFWSLQEAGEALREISDVLSKYDCICDIPYELSINYEDWSIEDEN